MKGDLDKWLCNMYFEVDPLKILNVRVHQRTKTVFYKKPQDKIIQEILEDKDNKEQSVHRLNSRMSRNEDAKTNLVASVLGKTHKKSSQKLSHQE